MGVSIGMSSGDTCCTPNSVLPPGNPNPYRFKLLNLAVVGDGAVVEVLYPDCTTYEGRKVIVFKDKRKLDACLLANKLDPHFTIDNGILARFEPTQQGWDMALLLLKQLV